MLFKKNLRDLLNRMNPAAASAKLGDTAEDIILKHNALVASHNALIQKHNALLAKMDADAGIADVNYEATQAGVELDAGTIVPLADR